MKFVIAISLIFILIYNLHAIKKPKTLFVVLLNICILTTSIFDLILSQEIFATTITTTIANNVRIYTCITTNYFCCYLIICCKLC